LNEFKAYLYSVTTCYRIESRNKYYNRIERTGKDGHRQQKVGDVKTGSMPLSVSSSNCNKSIPTVFRNKLLASNLGYIKYTKNIELYSEDPKDSEYRNSIEGLYGRCFNMLGKTYIRLSDTIKSNIIF